jgi:hypothetical protein
MTPDDYRREGWSAYVNGVPRERCPYEGEAAMWWRQGYDAAQRMI